MYQVLPAMLQQRPLLSGSVYVTEESYLCKRLFNFSMRKQFLASFTLRLNAVN